jgi:CelD/BcsL family acetyltransferase involved in cellulose biosynthesis
MQFETLNDISAIQALADDWRKLLVQSANNMPFLTPEYLLAWWGHLGAGEWQHAELHVLVARRDDGGLLGIAPMFLTERPGGKTALMFLGSHEISDYLDFIAPPQDLKRFLQGLFEHLKGSDAPQWDYLDLYNILDESPTLEILAGLSRETGWRFQQEQLQPAPCIQLPHSWDEYLAGLKKKQRHELRRKMRKASNHPVPVKWYQVEDQAALDRELETLFALMSTDAQKQAFLTPAMKAQMGAIARAAFAHGWLQLAGLQVGRAVVAMQLNFVYDNRIWGYNSGVDPNYRELSTGVVLLGHLLEQSIADRRAAFDFMRGGEEYKYRLGATARFVMRATVQKT